jgi:hypothetical protein
MAVSVASQLSGASHTCDPGSLETAVPRWRALVEGALGPMRLQRPAITPTIR